MAYAPTQEEHGYPSWCNDRLFGSKAFWIGLVILGFLAWWPIGLGFLLFSIGSGRMGCGMRRRHGGWRSCRHDESARRDTGPGSGNQAFDAYRADTLSRLEEERREFNAFLDRLRVAKDKAEFDEFMNTRRPPPAPPSAPAPEPTPN